MIWYLFPHDIHFDHITHYNAYVHAQCSLRQSFGWNPLFLQAEDMERWAVHFDSLHRASAMASEHREPDMSSCLSHRSVSGVLSTAWEGMSLFGGESLGRTSVDTVQGNLQRTRLVRQIVCLIYLSLEVKSIVKRPVLPNQTSKTCCLFCPKHAARLPFQLEF